MLELKETWNILEKRKPTSSHGGFMLREWLAVNKREFILPQYSLFGVFFPKVILLRNNSKIPLITSIQYTSKYLTLEQQIRTNIYKINGIVPPHNGRLMKSDP